jgi:hypothetical protein
MSTWVTLTIIPLQSTSEVTATMNYTLTAVLLNTLQYFNGVQSRQVIT